MSNDLPPLSEIAFLPQSLDFPSNFYIDAATVEKKFSQINNNKAPGPDGLTNWFLRDFAPVLCQPTCSIFNSSIRKGFVLLIWKSVNIIPIPKVHPSRNIESDLRPISLDPAIAKLLESIIRLWILETIEPHIDRNQFRSIKGKSTTLVYRTWCTTGPKPWTIKNQYKFFFFTLKRHFTESLTIQ